MADAIKEDSTSEEGQKTLVGEIDTEATPTQNTKEFLALLIPTATADVGLDAERGPSIGNDPFEVHWDGGDADLLNPRSLSYARKWLILLVVSLSALCV